MKYRTALDALVAEQVAIEVHLETARGTEDAASQRHTAARQEFDAAMARRKEVERRLEHTKEAIGVIAVRDEVSRETIETLVQRERS